MAFDSQQYQNLTLTTTNKTTFESLKQRVFCAARDGMFITLSALLTGKPDNEITHILNHITKEDRQKCSPLLIASRNGHEKIVKFLLMRYKPIIDQEGTVLINNYITKRASPLWCAVRGSHLKIVKLLVNSGANINHQTQRRSTPLRAACSDDMLDIVKYLIEHGSNIDLTGHCNTTCLMKAAFKGHKRIAHYLLERGANPDVKSRSGATALHIAAEFGHTEIVAHLLIRGAVMLQDNYGMTPLISAAACTQADVVEFIVSWCGVSRAQKIEAYELLGASFANNNEYNNLPKAYMFLHRSMKLRFDPSETPVLKSVYPCVEAYENHMESRTMTELESIGTNVNNLQMECLVIRERILGSHNPDVPESVIFCGAEFLEYGNFDRCIQLWMHALRLRHNIHLSAVKDLRRLVDVFCHATHAGVDLAFEILSEVLRMGILELERNKAKLLTISKSKKKLLRYEMDENILTIVYLLVLITKFIMKMTKREEMFTTIYTQKQEEMLTDIYRLVYKLNSLHLRTKDHKYSLLHLAVHPDIVVECFYMNNICSLPCIFTAKLLIKCGADVNVFDYEGNSPLHLIVIYQKPSNNSSTVHSLLMELIRSGVHMDAVNYNGQTSFEAAADYGTKIILNINSKLRLKCIAAKIICQYNILYRGQVPATLEKFIELHGVSRMVSSE